MKNIQIICLFSLLLNPILSLAAPTDMILVTVKPGVVFTPKGYDSNDNAQIVLYGKFHDVCHKVAPAKFSVDRVNHKITITNRAYTTKICEQMYVSTPYTTLINLGVLPKAEYEVYIVDENGNSSLAETLPVAAAKVPDAVDNFLYARIDDIQATKTFAPGSLQLVLKGTINNTCFSLKEVTTNLTAGNVYDILPIITVSGRNCEPTEVPFEKTVVLYPFPSAPVLLNVRSMGGQSIEKVIDAPGIE